MTYYIYENWVAEGHKARIHFANCSYCNNGKGIHPEAGTHNGRWYGPFATLAQATGAAKSTGGHVSRCRYCNPT